MSRFELLLVCCWRALLVRASFVWLPPPPALHRLEASQLAHSDIKDKEESREPVSAANLARPASPLPPHTLQYGPKRWHRFTTRFTADLQRHQ